MYREWYNPDGSILFREADAKYDEEGVLDYFQVSSHQMRDRLDLLGIDLQATKVGFLNAFSEVEDDAYSNKFDFDAWMADGRTAIQAGSGFSYESEHPWIDYVDVTYIIRAVIEMHGDMLVPVTWNIAELIARNYLAPDPTLCGRELTHIRKSAVSCFPVVVLTEGSTDASFLSSSLQLIYPHLVDFLRFMDFNVGPEGGAGALLRTVKSFAAAGIANRVIAIFDNDTAAADVLSSLRYSLPEGFRILQYPEIELARRYPTVGPTGAITTDVNGSAASLELYFGQDVLERADGTLTPIQWTGYFKRQDAYQGELMEKRRLQEAFSKKLEAAQAHGGPLVSQDWSGIIAILDSLRQAFSAPSLTESI